MNIIKAGLLSLVLTASCGVSNTAWAKEIRIATLEHDTPEVNVAILVMTEIYKRIGYDMKIVRFPGKRSLVEANLGTTDGELLRIQAIENQYPNLVRIPYAIGRLTASTLIRSGQPQITALSQRQGKRVGIIRGIEYTNLLTKNLDRQILNNIDGLFNTLLIGRVDVVLFPEQDARKYIERHGLENEIEMSPHPIVEMSLYHYLHKDSRAIVETLAKEIQRMTKNGDLENLLKHAKQAQN